MIELCQKFSQSISPFWALVARGPHARNRRTCRCTSHGVLRVTSPLERVIEALAFHLRQEGVRVFRAFTTVALCARNYDVRRMMCASFR